MKMVLLIATLFFALTAIALLLSTAYAQKRFRRKLEKEKLDSRPMGVLLYFPTQDEKHDTPDERNGKK